LLARAIELVGGCDCSGGCPACIGPVLAADETCVDSPKILAARVLELLVRA